MLRSISRSSDRSERREARAQYRQPGRNRGGRTLPGLRRTEDGQYGLVRICWFGTAGIGTTQINRVEGKWTIDWRAKVPGGRLKVVNNWRVLFVQYILAVRIN